MSDYSYLSNFRFVLRVDGAFDVPLKSVRAFNRENEYDYIQEGGVNDYVHMRRKPISKPFTLVVERYIPASVGISDPLTSGTALLLPLLLFVGKNTGGSSMNYSRYYVFAGAVVMSKEYGALDAERAGLLTESVTIGYNQMFCVTNPIESTDYPAWKFDANGSGNTLQKYSKTGRDPAQNSEVWYKIDKGRHVIDEKEEVLWEFDGTSKGGKGTTAHQVLSGTPEESRAKMEESRRLFNFAFENNKSKYTGSYKKSEKSAQNAKYSDKTLGEDIGIKELTKADMEALAREFKLTEDKKKTGNGLLSSKQHGHGLEPSKRTMTEMASLWEFDNKTKDGKGDSHANTAGFARNEKSREEMEVAAARREFGGIDEPVKEEFKGKSQKWEFDGTSKEGSGERNRQNAYEDKSAEGGVAGQGVAEASAEEMAAVSHKWEFGQDKYSTGGNDVKSAAVIPGVESASREELEGKSKRWEFDNNTKGGKGDRSRQNAEVSGTGENATSTGIGVQELSRKEMESAGNRWDFSDAYSKDGKGVGSRKEPPKEEISKKTMARMAEKWEFGASEKEMNGKGKKSSAKKDETRRGAHEENARRWQFDKKTKKGGGDTNRQIRDDIKELSEETMLGKARRFNLDEAGTKAGTGTSSRNTEKVKEKTRADHEEKSRKWEFDNKAKAGKGEKNRQNAGKQDAVEGGISGYGVEEPARAAMEAEAVHHVYEKYTAGEAPKHRRFDLDKAGTKAGTGVASRDQEKLPPEPSKGGMQSKAKKWKMSANGSKAGEGPAGRNKTGNIQELSKDQMARKAIHHRKANIADFLRR